MRFSTFLVCLLVFLVLFAPVRPLSATSFGITPSVLETSVERGDVLNVFVAIVRANPNEDEYLLVSTRDDPAGSIKLTSGERFLLPLGELEVRYTFAVQTSKLEGVDLLEAGIEFTSEEEDEGLGGNKVILGGVMKIAVSLVEPGQLPTKEDTEETVTPAQEAARSWMRVGIDTGFAVLAALALALTLAFAHRQTKKTKWLFVLCSATFLGAVIGWGVASGRIPLGRWEDTWETSSAMLEQGSYFLLTAEGEADEFLNPTAGRSQTLDGSWNYFATAPGRVYAVAADEETQTLANGNLFRFHETVIKPLLAASLPGTVSSIRENLPGTYALLQGERETDGTFYWCLAEVWESIAVECDFLERRFSDEIQSVTFSQNALNVVVVQTPEGAYTYDVWRETVEPLEESVPVEEEAEVFSKPFDTLGIRARFGIVALDEIFMLAPVGASYHPLSDFVWIERVPETTGSRVSLVDTRTLKRVFLTSVRPAQTLWWLQNGGFMASP